MPAYNPDALQMLRDRIARRERRIAALHQRYDTMGPGSDRGHLSWEAVSEQALLKQDRELLAKFEEGFA